mmetsp:Transcript_172160/g.418645  ORF Transcript_172160/g.418645 Transcript_172160/m.418645 type:complete len:211 (-) Transcript_172160:1297-1929(-)
MCSSCSSMACFAFSCTRRARPPEIPCSLMNLLSTANSMEFLLASIESRVMLEVMLDTNHDARKKPTSREHMAKHRSTGFWGVTSIDPAKLASDQCSAVMYCSKYWSSCKPRTTAQLPWPLRPRASQAQARACAMPRMAPRLLTTLKSSVDRSDAAFSTTTRLIFFKRSNLTSRSILTGPISWEALPAPSKITSIQSAAISITSGRNQEKR